MAFTSVSMSSFDAKLKQYYITKKKLYVMDGYKNKLLASIEKKTDGGGKQWNVAVGAASIVGGAGNYATAWANATAGTDINFYGPYKDRYHMGFVDDKVVRASRSPDGAIIPALEDKLIQVKSQFELSTNFQMYRSEAGELGTAASFTAGGVGGTLVFTANSAQPATQRLRPGAIVTFAALADGVSLRTTTWSVTAMAPNGGSVTLAPSYSSGSDIPVAGDTVFIDGDAYGAKVGAVATTAVNKALAGLASWVPPTEALAAAAFKNATRATDTRALAGIRLDATNLKLEEAFIQAGDTAQRYGANTSMIFMHPSRLSQLKQEMAGKIVYARVDGKSMAGGMSAKDAAKLGFDGIVLDAGGQQIIVAPDWACQYNYSWALEMDSLWFETVGAWPTLKGDIDGNSGKVFRLTDGVNNSYVNELVGYGEFLCSAPGHQVCIIHDATL